MSHKVNSRSLHETDDVAAFGGSLSTKKTNPLSIVSTAKFAAYCVSTVGCAADEQLMMDDCGFDDDIDPYGINETQEEVEDPRNIPPELLTDAEVFELEVQRRTLDEQLQDEEFVDSFMTNVRKPALDCTYKYPKISIMVSYI
jgi:hypothetical protein